MLKKLLLSFLVVATCATVHAQAVIWQENFDNGGTDLPIGWLQTTLATDGGWLIAEASTMSSTSFGIPSHDGNAIGTNDDGCNCDKLDELLQLPALDLTGQSNLYLMFDIYYVQGSYNGDVEQLTLEASLDGGTTWEVVRTMQGAGSWATRGVDISAYAGQSNVIFGFRYTDGGGWLFGAVLDNLRVVVADNILKGSTRGLSIAKYVDVIPGYLPYGDKALVGTELYASATFSNDGFVPITSFDATVTTGSYTETKSFTGVDLELFDTYDFDFDGAFTVDPGTNDVQVTISNINGAVDNDLSDNVVDGSIAGVTPVPNRKVVAEEGTGTWCQWCPRGAVMMNYLEETFPDNFIGIAVHNSTTDPMRVATYDAAVSALIPGYPSGLVDRAHVGIDPLEFEGAYVDRISTPPTVEITQNTTWDAATRKAVVTSNLSFLDQMDGNYRIAVVFTQDSVTGTAAGYKQVNVYSGGQVGPMGGFEDLANPVPAAQMVYNHVARALIGGFSGAANSVPTSNAAGSTHSFTSAAYTVPATQNVAKMHAISLIINQSTGEIENAATMRLSDAVSGTKDLTDGSVGVRMYPKPVADQAIITMTLKNNSDVQLRIVDMYGKTVREENYSNLAGENQIPFSVGSLPNGNYVLTLTAKGQTATEQFSIVR